MSHHPKKILAALAALAALGLGGAAIAGAAGTGGPFTSPAPIAQQDTPAGDAAEAPGTEVEDRAEQPERQDAEERVAPADAKRAETAAVAAVGGGKVTEVSAETPDEQAGADRPEKGDTPDPAYEQRIAYDVEVTKADGSQVEVHLDKSFNVLGTEKGDQQQGDHQDGDQEQAPASERG